MMWRSVHLWFAVAWALMAVPTVLWWKESILWVAFMSIYAIVGTHLTGHQAKRAEKVGFSDEQTAEVLDRLRMLCERDEAA